MSRGLILNVVISIPVVLGLGIIFVSRRPLSPHVLSIGFFLAGFTGVIVILRKESPMSIGSVRGKWAVVEGVIFTILCWGSALYIWIFGLQ